MSEVYLVNSTLGIMAVLVTCAFISPFLLKRFDISPIISTLILGILIGPNTFKILGIDKNIELLQEVGLILLMFNAGLTLDRSELNKYRLGSISFSFGSILFPFIIVFMFNRYAIQNPALLSVNIALLMMTYPYVDDSIVNNSKTKTIILGGSLFISIFALTWVSVLNKINTNTSVDQDIVGEVLAFFVVALIYYIVFIFGVSRLSKYIFKRNISREYEILYSMVILFGSVAIANYLILGPIIGAYVAGISIAGHIPHNSRVMNNLRWFGDYLFIPFFIIFIGMGTNILPFFTEINSFLFSISILLGIIFGKYSSLYVLKKLNKGREFNDIHKLLTQMEKSVVNPEKFYLIFALNYFDVINPTLFSCFIVLILIMGIIRPIFFHYLYPAYKKRNNIEYIEFESVPSKMGYFDKAEIEKVILPIADENETIKKVDENPYIIEQEQPIIIRKISTVKTEIEKALSPISDEIKITKLENISTDSDPSVKLFDESGFNDDINTGFVSKSITITPSGKEIHHNDEFTEGNLLEVERFSKIILYIKDKHCIDNLYPFLNNIVKNMKIDEIKAYLISQLIKKDEDLDHNVKLEKTPQEVEEIVEYSQVFANDLELDIKISQRYTEEPGYAFYQATLQEGPDLILLNFPNLINDGRFLDNVLNNPDVERFQKLSLVFVRLNQTVKTIDDIILIIDELDSREEKKTSDSKNLEKLILFSKIFSISLKSSFKILDISSTTIFKMMNLCDETGPDRSFTYNKHEGKKLTELSQYIGKNSLIISSMDEISSIFAENSLLLFKFPK